MAVEAKHDRFGIGWRPELAAAIFAHLDEIDIVEVIADDWFDASRSRLSALQTLAQQVPVTLHGIGLGLASTAKADERRLAKMARLVEAVRPESWSEHLAFVRAAGYEIGHLAAAPRDAVSVEAAAHNISRATEVVGSAPLMENISTLIDPPASTMTESNWLAAVQQASNCDLLLDLHNVYANCVNFGLSPLEFLDRLPLERVGAIHIAGGKWICASNGERRLLDDHQHPVPNPVYELVEEVAARVRQPLTVVLERDGRYPEMSALLAELQTARKAVQRGRARAVTHHPLSLLRPDCQARGLNVEATLAMLFARVDARQSLLKDPGLLRGRFELTDVANFDWVGLELAGRSFDRKRAGKQSSGKSRLSQLLRKLRRTSPS